MFYQIVRYFFLNFYRYFLRKPLHSEKSGSPPLFILSSGRSGSTLLRKILVRTEKVAIPPESYSLIPALTFTYIRFNHLSWEKLIDKLLSVVHRSKILESWKTSLQEDDIVYLKRYLEDKSLSGIIKYLYELHGQKYYSQTKLWGDKTPMLVYYIEELQRVFPDAKYIYMIRDGRDVVSSFLTHQLFFNIGKLSKRWLYSLKVLDKLKKRLNPEQILIVKYEDLVQDPERVVQQVCLFLKLEYNPAFLVNSDVYLGDGFFTHHNNIEKNISLQFIGKWKENLTKEQQKEVTERMWIGLKKWNYN